MASILMDFDDSMSAMTDTVDLEIDNDDADPDMASLSHDEIKEIAGVMEKDKTLRREERRRKKKLEELLEQKIVEIELKNIDDGDKFCLNCGEKFKFWINPKRICNECSKGICNGCTLKMIRDERICCLCFLKASKQMKTGKWFAMMSKQNGRFRRNPTTILVNSMRKLKMKISAPADLPSISQSNPEIFLNSQNGSIGSRHKPLYLRKEDSPKLVKKEVIKEAGQIPREIPIDVVDSASIDEVDMEPNKPDGKYKLHHLHPTNLESSKNISASTTSIYSETPESYKTGIPISGDILFSIYYDDDKNSLNIYIDQCRNLAVADRNKRQTNPYVKTYLLPDKTKSSKKKTTSKKSNVNPIFKETLMYYQPKESLLSRTLSVAIWHKRFLTYNYFLGEVHILLGDEDLSNKEPVWYPLKDRIRYPSRSGGQIYKGELVIKLKYKPSTRRDGKGSLHVLIVEAMQLESEGQTLNAYVKGYLLPERTNKTKKKTSVQKSVKNVKWDSLLQFTDVMLEELKDRALELSIYHHRKLKTNEFLGGVRLNLGLGHVPWMDAQGNEKTTWEHFLSNPNEYTEATLNLRPNLEF